jgi:ribulose-phosphate 3-epimerase
MVEMIPAINAKTFSDVENQIHQVEPYVNWIHLDVADGTFTKNILWHTPEDLYSLQTSLFIEVHLMVDEIEKKLPAWLIPNVRRVIFHLEVTNNVGKVIDVCHSADIEAGVSIHPDTSWEQLIPYANRADLFQTLAVNPGHAGQIFQKHTIKKIKGLRSTCPTCPIEVDGGMNKDTARRVIEAGATHIVASSAIFNGGNIKNNISQLQNILGNSYF